MVVAVETAEGFRHGKPVTLFDPQLIDPRGGSYNFDAAPDGERFLILAPVEDDAARTATVTLVQGWRALME